MRKLIFLLIGLLSFTINAQIPSVQFSKAFGGTLNEVANSVKQTSDGGYITVGTNTSTDGDTTVNHGGEDVWVVKFSSTGVIQWERSLGGSGNDRGNSIVETTNGYVIAGSTTSSDGDVTSNNGSEDVWVIKINSTGTTILWNRSLGGSGVDNASNIKQTSDGGFILAGTSQSNNNGISNNGSTDGWVIKLNSFGNIEIQKSIGGSLADNLNSAQQTSDGGYLVSGYSNSNNIDLLNSGAHGSSDFWIVKLSNNLTIQWSKALGGNGSDFSYCSQQTSDGGYVVVGYVLSSSGSGVPNGDVIDTNGSEDVWVVKLDSTGNVQWQNALGGSGEDRANSIKQTNEGGYILVGQTNSTDGDVITGTPHIGSGDAWIVKLSTTGVIQGEKNIGGNGADIFSSVQTTSDGGYIVAGRTNSTTGDLVGSGSHSTSSYDTWVVKFASDPLEVSQFTSNSLKLYPNPATSVVNISSDTDFDKIVVTDMTGKIVLVQESTNSISVDQLTTGVYILTAYSDQGQLQKRFIKQ